MVTRTSPLPFTSASDAERRSLAPPARSAPPHDASPSAFRPADRRFFVPVRARHSLGRHFQEIGMAKRSTRNTNAAHQHDAKVTSLFEGGWNPLDHAGGGAEDRDQSYRRTVRPQSLNQRVLVEAIAAHHLPLALGPAGTGKTYLAVTAAVEAFEAGKVGRIVLTRPAVEAGES